MGSMYWPLWVNLDPELNPNVEMEEELGNEVQEETYDFNSETK